jgi:general secretion pathway protein H
MSWRFKAGFTLLELIVVLAILALGFAYVAPNFARNLESVRFKSAVREVALELRRARGQALSQGKEVVFWVDVTGAKFGVDQDQPKPLPKTVELTLDTAETELIAPGRGGIRFFPDGSSTGGRIVLRCGGQAKRVDVNWLTGRVSIADHAG